MKILNINSRQLVSSLGEAGTLIDSLSSNNDRLWPRDTWPPMKFDRELKVGANGGHGPVRYEVVEYVPGRKVLFRFNAKRGPCVGLKGNHGFHIESESGGNIVLKHILEGDCYGAMALRWTLVFEPLHNALIEDALDRAELVLTGKIISAAKWGIKVNLLRAVVRAATSFVR